jgi:hypothetical protein
MKNQNIKINLTDIEELSKEGDKHQEWMLALVSSLLSDMVEAGNDLLKMKSIVEEHKRFIYSKEAEYASKVGVNLEETGYLLN